MKALVVDDDEHILSVLSSHLPKHGFAVDSASRGAQALTHARVNEYDVIVLDLNLPDMTGEEVCRALRRGAKSHAPVLMLSVVSDPASKARLLNAGADDYLSKPFSFEELLARMRALTRRPAAKLPEMLVCGDLTLDSATQTVRRRTQTIALTLKEFALLEYLMRHAGATVSKTALIEHVWESSADYLSNSIETHIGNLRRKIGLPALIKTIHSRGYMIG